MNLPIEILSLRQLKKFEKIIADECVMANRKFKELDLLLENIRKEIQFKLLTKSKK